MKWLLGLKKSVLNALRGQLPHKIVNLLTFQKTVNPPKINPPKIFIIRNVLNISILYTGLDFGFAWVLYLTLHASLYRTLFSPQEILKFQCSTTHPPNISKAFQNFNKETIF